MSDIYLERLRIMREFQLIIEKGIYMGCKIKEDEIANLYRINTHYAITYFCTKKKLITKIEWHKTLSEQQKVMFSLDAKS